MAVRSYLSDEIKQACDKYLESKGWIKMSFKDLMNKDAQEGERRKKIPPEDPMEKIAQEIERESQE